MELLWSLCVGSAFVVGEVSTSVRCMQVCNYVSGRFVICVTVRIYGLAGTVMRGADGEQQGENIFLQAVVCFCHLGV